MAKTREGIPQIVCIQGKASQYAPNTLVKVTIFTRGLACASFVGDIHVKNCNALDMLTFLACQ
jgi:hypothetical protein